MVDMESDSIRHHVMGSVESMAAEGGGVSCSETDRWRISTASGTLSSPAA